MAWDVYLRFILWFQNRITLLCRCVRRLTARVPICQRSTVNKPHLIFCFLFLIFVVFHLLACSYAWTALALSWRSHVIFSYAYFCTWLYLCTYVCNYLFICLYLLYTHIFPTDCSVTSVFFLHIHCEFVKFPFLSTPIIIHRL